MIYLIRDAAFKDKNDLECTEFEVLYKIGYTSEGSRKSRFDAYITENPTAQILYLIPNGDEQDERNLHHHFKKYKKYGNEWFECNKEILDFFKTHTTKESLQELETHRTWKQKEEFKKERNKLLREYNIKYINKVLSFSSDTKEFPALIDSMTLKISELLEKCLDIEGVEEYFTTTWPDIDFTASPIINQDIQKEIDNIEMNFNTFEDRMRYIYSLEVSPEFMKLLLDNLTDTGYAKYYYSISRERASALKYRRGNLEKEYKSIKSFVVNSESIISEIKNKFKIGEKYSKADIKETLKVIYESNGYNKTPKANDLEEYFEIKQTLISNKLTGKRDSGFEIVSLKMTV